MDKLVLYFNTGGLVFGIILGITSFNYYRKLNKTKKGVYWFIGCVATCLIFTNGIIKIVDIMDEQRKKEAFELLKERFEDRGDHESESYDNLQVVVIPQKLKWSTSYNIYVANFNKLYTYTGKIEITIKNKKDKKVFSHVTEKVNIKPGKKKEIKNVNYDTWHSGYSWKWLGELKK